MSWWRSVRLVAAREIVERMRSRVFLVVTSLLALIGVAAVVVPRIVGDDDRPSYTLVLTGQAPVRFAEAMENLAVGADFTVRLDAADDRAGAEVAVRDGDADAAVDFGSGADGTRSVVLVGEDTSGELLGSVDQATTVAGIAAALDNAGLSDREIDDALGAPPPERVEVADPDRQEEAFVGFLITVALYVALLVGGNQVAQGVAVEKSSRIAEVLLGTIQAPQLMAGKIIGIGLLVGGQLLALATPIVVGALVTTSVDLPDDLASDVAVGLMWFVLGFALYSAAYAALGALVDRLEELQSATTPLTMLLVAGYLVSITLSGRLDDPLAVAASLFPLTAPLVMPLRWAAGSASLAELVLAVVLTALTAVLLIRTGGVVYRRAIIRGGRRLRLREVLRG